MKVFFDVDGVIIDGWHSVPERRKPWDTTIEQDIGINREALRRALFTPLDGATASLLSRCIRGETDLKDVLARLLPNLGYPGSVDAFLKYWFSKDSNVNPAVLDVVRRLKKREGVELYLATNQEHHRATYLWNDLGLKDLFIDIFHSARLGVQKDDVAFFARINAQLGIGVSERPLFFDDAEVNVKTARDAGWDAHVFETADGLVKNSRLGAVWNRSAD